MFKEISKLIDSQVPKQFDIELPEAVSVYSIPIDEVLKINAQYQQEIAKLDEEDRQALSMMDKIYTS